MGAKGPVSNGPHIPNRYVFYLMSSLSFRFIKEVTAPEEAMTLDTIVEVRFKPEYERATLT